MQCLLVLCNVPDQDVARKIAQRLVEERVAACVNILAACDSVYRWGQTIESAREIPIFIKTTTASYAEVERLIRELHPYELPEIIAVSVDRGLPAYLDWVVQETRNQA